MNLRKEYGYVKQPLSSGGIFHSVANRSGVLKERVIAYKTQCISSLLLDRKCLASMNKTESQEKLIKLAHLYEISRAIQRAQSIVELCQQIVKSLSLAWCQSDYIFPLMEINNQCLKLDNFTHALNTSSVSQEDIRTAYNSHANGYIRKSVDFDDCIKIASIKDFWFSTSILYEP